MTNWKSYLAEIELDELSHKIKCSERKMSGQM